MCVMCMRIIRQVTSSAYTSPSILLPMREKERVFVCVCVCVCVPVCLHAWVHVYVTICNHHNHVQKNVFRTRSILDDFREAYYWLRQNTDDKARVMSWWDYGYQIAGMGNRTTLVDNNTWNNSHICLLYTSPSPRDLIESRMPSSA